MKWCAIAPAPDGDTGGGDGDGNNVDNGNHAGNGAAPSGEDTCHSSDGSDAGP